MGSFLRAELAGGHQVERRGAGGLALFGGDRASFDHLVEHIALALPGSAHVGVRVEVGRRLRQACQQRCLGQGQLAGRFAEVGFGGGFDPVGAIAVRDLVHVHLEDLVLAVAAGQLHRQEGLFDLAFGRLLRAQEGVFDELLGDGRGAALGGACAHPLVGCAHHRADVEAGVVVEGRVLGGDGRVARHHGDLGQMHERAATALRVVELLQQPAVAIENSRGLEQLTVRQRTRIRQIPRVVRVQAHDAGEGERRQEDHDREECQQEPHTRERRLRLTVSRALFIQPRKYRCRRASEKDAACGDWRTSANER